MRDQLSRAFGKVPLQSSTGPVMLRPWLGEDSFDSSMASQAVPHVPHVVTGNSANSALSIDGVCTLPRVASIAFGESAAGRPTNEQTGTRSQTTDAPYASGLAHSEAVHCLSMKRPEDGGQAFSQIDIADEQDDQRTDCRYVTVESANLLSVTAQTARICRDCGKVIAPSLHSSPSTVLPRASVLLCLAFSLLVFQVIDAGGAHVVLAHQNPLSKTALSGRVAFLIGQSIGSFVGSSLHSMGRWALLVDLALGSLFAAIAGTSITYIMLDIFRGLTGVTSGIMLSLVLHDLRSLLASWVPTSMAALLVLLLAAVAQVCGGWLSPLIVHSLHWQWLYWGSSIALFCNTCATAFLVSLKRAQRSSSLQQAQNKRATVAFLKRSALVVWLPITHPHLSLATMSMAIAACIHVTVLATVHFLWKLTFRFSSHRAFLTTTVCLLISLLLALVIVAILGRKHPGKGGKRLTLYDEKSPQAAGCRGALPERALLQTAIALLVMAGGLLFMALATKTTVSWVATALLLVIIGTASLLTIDSGLRYILDIYRPTGDGQGDWGKHYVVAASGSCLGTVIGACAQALMMSPLAFVKLGFSTLCCALACCALVGAVIAVAVYRLGPGWRKKRWDSLIAASSDSWSKSGAPGSHSEIHDDLRGPRAAQLQVSAPQLQMSTYPMTFQGPSLRHQDDVEELDALKSSTLSTSPEGGTMHKSSRQQSLFSSSTVGSCTDLGEAVGERRQQSFDYGRSVTGFRL